MRGCGMLIAILWSLAAWGVEPSVDELATAGEWSARHFLAEVPADPAGELLVVENHDPVQKNKRFGSTLRVGDETFERGLFCHAPSHLLIKLPGKARTFYATAGVDLNPDTAAGQGSVVFTVEAGGQELFRSPVLQGKDAGVPVEVALNGAAELLLKISDAGDGIASDQGNWADARVVLEDGREVWLDTLPMPGGPVQAAGDGLPFSFVYGGKTSAELLPGWKREVSARVLDSARTEHALVFSDPATGLQVRCVGVSYADYPVVEWTLYFKNTGAADTPILEKILPLDLGMIRGDRGEFTLHHARGSACRQDDFAPLTTALAAGSTLRLAPEGGRSSNGVLPYFNVESTCGDGALFAVGWPGQWVAEFVRDNAKGLHLTAGQEQTHFKLLPGEEVRTPLIAMQFWKGDWQRAQNVWRRWMVAHGMTRPGGQPPKPQFLAASSRAYEEMIKADTEKQIMFIDRYREEGIPLEYWWMDAGWYVQEKGWPQVGTWEVDTRRFPQGLRPISDHAHAQGIKILVWFEPERVAAETWLAEQHPEWILGGSKGGLLDLGNDEALQWLIEHVDGLINSEGIDLYRQDFNMDPLGLWRQRDAEDRQGISEIKHVTGLLAYWDALLARHPGMLIDTCASGGRRIDLETARRALPLWRSDYAFEPVGHQGMTYGLSMWLPYHGTGTVGCVDAPYYGGGKTPVEPYAFWSNAAPSISCGLDMRVPDIDYPAFRSLVEQWKSVNGYYYGDFYALTPFSLDHGAWMAWQFHMPETQEGMVQVFRRKDSVYVSGDLVLQGLDRAARYEVQDVAGGAAQIVDGAELLDQGLRVELPARPDARVYRYRKAG